MRAKLNLLAYQIRNALMREEAQDLIEYALLTALISLAATASMSYIGKSIYSYYVTLHQVLLPYLT